MTFAFGVLAGLALAWVLTGSPFVAASLVGAALATALLLATGA